jgi:hypothetical protein
MMVGIHTASVVSWSEFLAANPEVWVAVSLEVGTLSLVRINEDLLERKVAALVYKIEINGRGVSAALTTRHHSISKSWY